MRLHDLDGNGFPLFIGFLPRWCRISQPSTVWKWKRVIHLSFGKHTKSELENLHLKKIGKSANYKF